MARNTYRRGPYQSHQRHVFEAPANALRKARLAARFTQAELSITTGLGRSRIAHWETARAVIPLDAWRVLRRALPTLQRCTW